MTRCIKFLRTLTLPTFFILLFILSAAADKIRDVYPLNILKKYDISSVVAIHRAHGKKTRTNVIDTTKSKVGAEQLLVDLGSITKFVTAVVVLHLVDEGKLNLQSSLSKLLPNVPEDKASITVHQLLTHTSGLQESTGSDEEKLDRETFIGRVFSMSLLHTPGEKYLYSDAGYSLLAAIIEIKSGKTYETYLLENVLKPRKLPAIGYQTVYDSNRSLRSFRTWQTLFQIRPIHLASWGGTVPGWNLIGNGGVVSTAENFLRFWQTFLRGEIVSPNLVSLALTPHVDEGNGKSHYGYGVVIEQSSKFGKIYWHDGGNEVFSSEFRYLDKQKLTLFSAGPSKEGFHAMKAMTKEILP